MNPWKLVMWLMGGAIAFMLIASLVSGVGGSLSTVEWGNIPEWIKGNAPDIMTALPWIAVALFSLFAIFYAFNYPKNTGMIAGIIFLFIAVYLGIPKLQNTALYGDKADVVEKARQKRAAERALEEIEQGSIGRSKPSSQSPRRLVEVTWPQSALDPAGKPRVGTWSHILVIPPECRSYNLAKDERGKFEFRTEFKPTSRVYPDSTMSVENVTALQFRLLEKGYGMEKIYIFLNCPTE